ncbi:MBL fold metallo-hydrolase [Micromonospora sp. PLK6-60]|uniref:MBL fold metallo-hydrolase n=1 Tax=Micromonospora sp. PLK6-60 TaxID=2873383 RepID=UPI001CA65484|nr:MBL fold metallo-hydrolase [Micromonospora sp. PLK6-60]MBY8870251.1 MBL fold metallo-hydrolase [Micromonospora sp. PLK6-60]
MSPPLRHLAGRVWLWPHDEDPATVQGCVAVVADAGGTLLVDAGNSPTAARRIRAAVRAAGLPLPTRLVYTHHHWDHTWGACAWPGVEIIGHATGARILAAEADRPWSEAYLREQADANPRLAPSLAARARAMRGWEGFRVVPPDVEFADTLDLPGGVRLRHVGGRHAEDSTVVAVPDSGVLLVGDCCYPPPLHLRAPDDGVDVRLIRRLAETYDDYDWFVDSHDHPKPREALRRLLAGGAG